MNIEASKLELVKLIVNIDNKEIIDKLIKAIKSDDDDFWTGLTTLEKDEIRMGLKQLEEGKRISLDEFLNKVT